MRLDESGIVSLTDYASMHIDECCLIFDIKAKKNKEYGVATYRECILFKNAISDTILEAWYEDSEQGQAILERAAKLKKTASQLAKIKRDLPASFSGSLKALMKFQGITVEKLAETVLMSPRTLQRLRNEEDYPVKLPMAVALCIGMQLHPILSRDLIEKAKLGFKGTEEHVLNLAFR